MYKVQTLIHYINHKLKYEFFLEPQTAALSKLNLVMSGPEEMRISMSRVSFEPVSRSSFNSFRC